MMRALLDDVLERERLVGALVRLGVAHPGWRFRRVPFRVYAQSPDAFAAALADDVRRGRFVAGTPRPLRLPGGRQVALVPLPDLVLADAFAAVLGERAPPRECVWSYRPGLSTVGLVRSVTAFMRAEWSRQQARPLVERAIFTLRQDVQRCSDSIRVDDEAPLWGQLQSALGVGDDDDGFRLLRVLVRPRPRRRGILQGTPLNNVLVNVHLRPIDDALHLRGGSLYARFGDDTVFMTSSAPALREARLAFDAATASLSLTAHADKGSMVALSKAARTVDDVPGAQHIDLVGLRLNADGTVALKPAHARGLVRAVARRAASAVAAVDDETPGAPEAVRLKAAVRAASTALDAERADAPPASRLVREVVTCRLHLQWLDRSIAGAVAAAVVGRAPPRAFRDLGWEAIRRAGMWSLVEGRNGS